MITEKQKQTIREILAPFQPIRVGIFGSFARGENGRDSDLDILVAFSKSYNLFDLVDLREKLSVALQCKIDLVTEPSVHPSVKPFIDKDLILIQNAERA